eukprot:COSAG02_NODE_32188_length_520_cov_1.332542_2_plen_67_part_01
MSTPTQGGRGGSGSVSSKVLQDLSKVLSQLQDQLDGDQDANAAPAVGNQPAELDGVVLKKLSEDDLE